MLQVHLAGRAPGRCLIWLLVGLFPAPLLARGGWEDPPGGFDYVYEASSGQDAFVDGSNVVGLLDGSWAQQIGVSYWAGNAPGVFNTTQTDPTGSLLPPAPGGIQVVCPGAELGEDGQPLCYLAVEDVGNPTALTPPYIEPSNRKIYLYHPVTGNSEGGWTLVVRMRLSPQALDPNVDMTAGYNGAAVTDLPMVAVHDGGEGTVGFSINDAGKLVVLADAVTNEIDIGNPTEWVTVWLSAVERTGTPEGRYDLKVYLDGATTPALVLAAAAAPLSEIAGSPDDWIALGSGRTAADAAFQIDYVAYKQGAWDPGQSILCPTSFACGVTRAVGLTAVNLSWAVPAGSTFDSFDLKRDATVLAAGLPSTTTTYNDLEPLPGHHTYELVARGPAGDCTSVCEEAMCAYDLQCGFRPGAVPGLVDVRLTWANPGGIDGFTLIRRLQREGGTGEMDEDLGALPGTAIDHTDVAIDTTDLTRITYTLTATIGTTTCQVQCRPTTCPHDLGCQVDRTGASPAVSLSWGTDRPFDSIAIGRRSDPALPFTPLTTLAGDATSYRDPDVAELGFYEYEVTGNHSGTAEACAAVTCGVFLEPVEAPYAAPAGGWDYILDAESLTSLLHNPVAGEPGNLDGNWIRSTAEDFWDSSVPGDTADPPGPPGPGGIGLVSLAASDPCRASSRKVLLLEDPGDPRALGFPDPSNRKLLLGYDLGHAGENLLRDGVTFSVRLRLRPQPVDIPPQVGNPPWDGDDLDEGLGMAGVHFRNLGTPEAAALGASASLAFALDETGAVISSEPARRLDGIQPQEFRTFWATVQDAEADGVYDVNLYLNGTLSSIAVVSALQVPRPGVAGNDPGFGPDVTNFLALGLTSTDADASVEIDFVAVKAGVHPPVAETCGNRPAPPALVSAVGGQKQVTLTWQAPQGGAAPTGYAVYRSATPGGPYQKVADATASQTSHVDGGLPDDTQFCYVVRTKAGAAESTNSLERCARTQPGVGGKTFRRGNVNGDALLDISDAIGILGFLFLGQADRVACVDAADIKDKGSIDISDAISVLNFLFQGGAAPAAPGPEVCGPDVNQESPDLGCVQGC